MSVAASASDFRCVGMARVASADSSFGVRVSGCAGIAVVASLLPEP